MRRGSYPRRPPICPCESGQGRWPRSARPGRRRRSGSRGVGLPSMPNGLSGPWFPPSPPLMSFQATVLTLYPEMFPGPLGVSIAGRALEEGAWALDTVQIRDFATDKHRSVDDTPAGGGAGMVLKVDVLAAAIDSVADGRPMLALTPRGAPLTQDRVRQLAVGEGVILLCGRFEGFDERIF